MTHSTISELLARADRTSKAVIAVSDAKFASVKHSDGQSASTAGQLIAKALAGEVNDATSVFAQLKTIRAEQKSQMQLANELIDEAQLKLNAILAAKDFIAGDSQALPDRLPDHIKSALVQLRAARKVAPGAAPTLAATLAQAADDAQRTVSHLKSVVARRQYALNIASAKGRLKAAERIASATGESTMATYTKRAKMALKRAEAQYDAAKKRGIIQ